MKSKKMNTKKFNRLYSERINSLLPFLMSIPDNDLRQEAYIGIYEALKTDHNGTDKYLRTRAKWKQSVALRKGRSVDNGFYKRNELQIIHYDQKPSYNRVFSQILPDNGNVPLDKQVLDKICLEHLVNNLTKPELQVFQYKVIDEMYDIEVMRKLRIGSDKYKKMKAGLRLKINQAFDD